ncbi:MAG: hypothetical protein KME30_26200 [Iphinoe sp. HA4291-MV1]|jgi:hypothetical protein|nr:hypothetical protein [Iphinoe sp. HA4291-MV1]
MKQLIDLDRVKLAQGHIELTADSKSQAKNLAYNVAVWANKFERDILIFYPHCKNPIRIPPTTPTKSSEVLNMTNLVLPSRQGIVTAKGRLSPSILEVLYFLAENPNESAGLVRLSDERQIALTDSSIALLTEADGGLEAAVERRRADYWHLPDLEEFNRLTHQSLEPDNQASTTEFRLRTHDPNGENWLLSVNRYRLVSDDMGELYHVFINTGLEECAAPVGLVTSGK